MINLKIIISKLSNKIHTIKSTITIAGICKFFPSHKVALSTQGKVSEIHEGNVFIWEMLQCLYSVKFKFFPRFSQNNIQTRRGSHVYSMMPMKQIYAVI